MQDRFGHECVAETEVSRTVRVARTAGRECHLQPAAHALARKGERRCSSRRATCATSKTDGTWAPTDLGVIEHRLEQRGLGFPTPEAGWS